MPTSLLIGSFFELNLQEVRKVLKVAALEVSWKKNYLGSKYAASHKDPLPDIGLTFPLVREIVISLKKVCRLL